MAMVLTNALLLDYGPPRVREGALRIEDSTIADLGPHILPEPKDEIVDCGGAAVMPGLVNGHTHLYSALATGMPAPRNEPSCFREILERVWWRLDRALNKKSIRLSAAIGALDAVRCGTTTLIDHHASPNYIAGSLDVVENGVQAVGLRGILCYEVTDRNGLDGATAGLAENRRYLEKCREGSDDRFGALVGAHAGFTLSDDSLSECAALATEFDAGVHIHVAEDPCDDALCRERYGAGTLERLERCGITALSDPIAARSILAHCTHWTPSEARCASVRVAAVAHNPRSNMNNRVGHAPIADLTNLMLGTDGIGSDLFAEARFAFLKARDAGTNLSSVDIADLWSHAAQVAGDILGVRLGRLEPGAAADLVITDYRPATPLDQENAADHLLWALGPQHVRDVMIRGKWVLRNRAHTELDEKAIRNKAKAAAADLWSRMDSLDPAEAPSMG